MAMATWVLTCRSWFCMSRITCLIIFSGCSALSTRSLRLARSSVATRSSSAMMDSFIPISLQLSAFSLVFFVDGFALGALGATKVASDYHSDGDTHGQPDRDVAGGHAHRGADAGAESNAQDNLHGWLLHVSFLDIDATTAGTGGTPVLHRFTTTSLLRRLAEAHLALASCR